MPPMYHDLIGDSNNALEWEHYSEPQLNVGLQYPNGRIPERAGRAIGGSTTHNGMIFNRGNRRDFDEWEQKYGAMGWAFKDVLPFFIRYENNTDWNIVKNNPGYRGVGGSAQISSLRNPPRFMQSLQNIFNELGFENIDFNGPKQKGTMIMQQFINTNGFRVSSGSAYVDPNPNPNNLDIVTNALVYKILFNNFTAIGVEFARNDIPYRVYARKEVILSAGAVNSPQILMLSGIGISNHLRNFGIPVLMDLPVGNNYNNHPIVSFPLTITDPALFYSMPQLDIQSLNSLYFNRSGRLSEAPLLSLYFNTKNNFPKDWPNFLLEILMVTNPSAVVIALNLVRVRSTGSIRLQSASPFIPPRIDPSFLSNPQDFEDTLEGTRFVLSILERTWISSHISLPSFESIGCPSCPNRYMYECTEGLRCLIRYSTITSWHACCSNRMGAVDRDDVVVDPILRVKNIRSLRICDASVFPWITNGNTMAPTNMVGEKCAQIIKDCYNNKFDY